MAVYADYLYYSTEFLGTAIAEADFPALALKASAYVDQFTFQRAAVLEITDENYPAVQNAMCAVAEELQGQDTNPTDGIKSESQGRYSVSFFEHSSRAKSNQTKLEDAAKLWLANTGLMFAGFASGEYGAPDVS